jgi:2-isopropylmalate synthase
VRILDSTLREGEQAPSVTLDFGQRFAIAQKLDQTGVDFIEVSSIVSADHRALIGELCSAGLHASVVAHCRAIESDIDAVSGDCPGAKWVAVFISTSDVHLDNKLKISRIEALGKISRTTAYAKDHGYSVRFTAEDAGRTDRKFLAEACMAASAAGADRISLPDTVGSMTPDAMEGMVAFVRSAVSTPLDLHCHNDLGLALANTIAGLASGADCAHVTINGVGERCGIASLAEVAMALQTLYGVETGINTENLVPLSKMLAECSGVPFDQFTPVVGENAFRHKGGTHLAALLANPESYEAFAPERVGNSRRMVLGEHSGKNVVGFLNDKLGIGLDEGGIEKTVARLKDKRRDLFEFSAQ